MRKTISFFVIIVFMLAVFASCDNRPAVDPDGTETRVIEEDDTNKNDSVKTDSSIKDWVDVEGEEQDTIKIRPQY